ncbi:MAG: DUF2933 domain-containing protein [Chloroflexi bacterium]|nr:DUF2933 domain-containing protein [Chloroflexota bacterium]
MSCRTVWPGCDPKNWGLIVFLVFAAGFLITEPITRIFGVLMFGLLLVCPSLHVFLNGRHGDRGSQADHQSHAAEGEK